MLKYRMFSAIEVIILNFQISRLFAVQQSQAHAAHNYHDRIYGVHEYLNKLNYNVLVPPVSENYSIGINVNFEIVKIASVETSKGEMSVVGTILTSWYDKRLRWDHTQYKDVVCIKRSASTLWFPELLLINGVSDNLQIRPSGGMDSRLAVHHDGGVYWTHSSLFTITCNMDVIRFPKDAQTCHLMISPSPEDYHTVYLNVLPKYEMLGRFVNSTDWILYKTRVKLENRNITTGTQSIVNLSVIMIGIKVYRAEETYIIVMVTPIVLLTCLIFVPFLLPPQLGPQKVIMPVSIFVSYNIFMLMLERIMPKSQYPPVIGYLFVAMMGMCTFVEFMQCITVKYWNDPGNRNVPKWLYHLYRKFLQPMFTWTLQRENILENMPIVAENRKMSLMNGASTSQRCSCQDIPVNQMTVKEFWEDMARINDRIGMLITSVVVFSILVKETFDVFIKSDLNAEWD